MRTFITGLIVGSALTAVVAGAGTFYDSKGNVVAPRGSQQQFDYFRERQLFLDAGAMRRHQEQQHLHPCGK
jgi:hypothetical protein